MLWTPALECTIFGCEKYPGKNVWLTLTWAYWRHKYLWSLPSYYSHNNSLNIWHGAKTHPMSFTLLIKLAIFSTKSVTLDSDAVIQSEMCRSVHVFYWGETQGERWKEGVWERERETKRPTDRLSYSVSMVIWVIFDTVTHIFGIHFRRSSSSSFPLQWTKSMNGLSQTAVRYIDIWARRLGQDSRMSWSVLTGVLQRCRWESLASSSTVFSCRTEACGILVIPTQNIQLHGCSVIHPTLCTFPPSSSPLTQRKRWITL